MREPAYRRVLLKLGGESLAGPEGFGIDPQRAEEVAKYVQVVRDLEVEVAIVIGAGNLWRGRMVLKEAWSALLQITWVCWVL